MATLQPTLVRDDCLFTHVEPWLDANDILQLWYFDGPPDTPDKLARCFAAVPQRVMFSGHVHAWFIGTPDGQVPWTGHADSTDPAAALCRHPARPGFGTLFHLRHFDRRPRALSVTSTELEDREREDNPSPPPPLPETEGGSRGGEESPRLHFGLVFCLAPSPLGEGVGEGFLRRLRMLHQPADPSLISAYPSDDEMLGVVGGGTAQLRWARSGIRRRRGDSTGRASRGATPRHGGAHHPSARSRLSAPPRPAGVAGNPGEPAPRSDNSERSLPPGGCVLAERYCSGIHGNCDRRLRKATRSTCSSPMNRPGCKSGNGVLCSTACQTELGQRGLTSSVRRRDIASPGGFAGAASPTDAPGPRAPPRETCGSTPPAARRAGSPSRRGWLCGAAHSGPSRRG